MGGAVSAAAVLAGTERWHLERGEALSLLQGLPSASVDAVVTDPPYSSGGQFRGDRSGRTGLKYVQTGVEVQRPDFSGDTRDQRSFEYWCVLWLSEAARVAKPGAPLCVFSDWRQLPVVTDAVQAGGWVWRGVAVWDKTEGTRPRVGGFRSQCEYIVWASNGPMDEDVGKVVGCLPGVFRHSVLQDDKFHQTGKPTPLMADVVKVCQRGGVVLDPFSGSGTTIVAALNTGRRGIGFELTQEYSDIAKARCAAAANSTEWREPSQLGLLAGHDDQ